MRDDKAVSIHGRTSVDSTSHLARRFTITAVGTNLSSALPQEYQPGDDSTKIDVVDFAARPAPLFNDHMSNGTRQDSGRMPPTVPASRRPFSWHRSTSKTSSGSGISPFEEHKQPHWPLPSSESTVVGQNGTRRHSGRMPPTISSSRRPFSWHRSTSKTSSSSGISPFDEHKQIHWPLPSYKSTAVGQSLQEVDPIPNRTVTPPPAQRSFSTTFRRSSGAPQRTPSKSVPSQQRILRHLSSSSSDLGFNVPTPTIQPPPPAALREPYHLVTLSRVDENVCRRPPGRVEPDMERYISALADTDNPRYRSSYGSRDRLYIREEDEEEEEEERLGGSPREYPIRRSTQTDRSSWF